MRNESLRERLLALFMAHPAFLQALMKWSGSAPAGFHLSHHQVLPESSETSKATLQKYCEVAVENFFEKDLFQVSDKHFKSLHRTFYH